MKAILFNHSLRVDHMYPFNQIQKELLALVSLDYVKMYVYHV